MTCWKCRCPKFSFSMCLDSLVFCRHFSTTDCNLLVDDCDEDTFPPTIDLDEATHGIIFLDDQSAQDWLHHHSVAGDDCAENLKTTTALYDNSIIGQHTYSVTVWDERCYGKSPSANNTKFYTLSICHESLNQFLKGSGCDGIDQDCDGKDDDCDEDRTPPTINFDKAAMPSHPFSTQEEAMEFLNCQVSVEDDCSTKVERTFKHLADQTVGITNTYRVTAVDTRCEGKSVYATSTLDIEVMVDEEAPSIFCGFHTGQEPMFDSNFIPTGDQFRFPAASTSKDGENGEPLVIDPERFKKEKINVNFWYSIQVSCIVHPLRGNFQ